MKNGVRVAHDKIEVPIKSRETLREEAKQHKTDTERIRKWKEMLSIFPNIVHAKLKSRGRKGIPDAIRGYAWSYLV
jgi:hypothetical protein